MGWESRPGAALYTSSAVSRLRVSLPREISPGRFRLLAGISLAALFLVVTSGAFVRLTGSGLGCENWPRCGSTPYPQQGFHAFVEFGNRVVAAFGILLTLVAWLASRRTPGLPRFARLAALGAFLGAFAQIPLGGVTVIFHLHPLLVMSHFLLALAVVALAVVTAVEAWSLEGGPGARVGPGWLRQVVVWLGVPACAALVVTGAIATASGPHPGANRDVQRLGLGIVDTVYWHVRVAAVVGIGTLLLGVFLFRLRRWAPGVFVVWCALLTALTAQAVLGEVQYRNALPWGLVLAHVFLAATIWTLAVALAFVLWRPPPLLLAEERAAALADTGSAPHPASR
jgi:cytochrome c oxidase assembly protein subunit 15